jgi:glycyl-tRNA synthetase beta chain
VTFQEKLGSYYDKTQRILALLPRAAEVMGCAARLSELETAAHMLKCDLVTEMVKEFTDLQGIVGGLYAQAEGYPEPVWRAISEQYMPKTTSAPSPSTAASSVLALIDRLDTVCGCFSVGLVPTGSRDPLAVRRQGNGTLKILLDHRIPVSLGRLIDWSLATHAAATAETRQELLGFFEGRLRFLLEEAGYAYDAINAGLAVGFDDPLDALERVKALHEMRAEPDFLSVASNFKRIVNILQQAGTVAGEPDPGRMTDEAELALFQAYQDVLPRVKAAHAGHDYAAALRVLASMRRVVDEFFDKVLVMAEDSAVRANRLALLKQVSNLFLGIADISEIVLERA